MLKVELEKKDEGRVSPIVRSMLMKQVLIVCVAVAIVCVKAFGSGLAEAPLAVRDDDSTLR